jgi:two-component system phosphate regulon sensor histidine kinase PhoR
MTLLLLATVLIMILVIVCIIYQIRIIVRQDKIAKLREDFSYAMIHDMKTPLSSILMGTQILETGKLDAQPEKKARYFRILKEEGEHLLSLTNKVLTLSKLENQQLKLDKETCSLRPMLEDLAEKYKAKALKRITYRWNLQADTVYADEEFLKEALSNLIDNAVKYSGEEVEITFSSGRLPGEDYIKVHDTGFGIPLKDQSKIFEKYERASAAGRSRHGGPAGFGLGLNYVLRVVEAHRGRVTLESIEGEYSEFTIYLPAEENAAERKLPEEEQ